MLTFVEWIAAGVAALAVLGEVLHARRTARIASLAFGPARRPAHWVKLVPVLRALGFGSLAWGLLTLMVVDPKVHISDAIPDGEHQHLLIVLDVSPSMQLKDAGPTQAQTRSERARDVLDSLFSRVTIGRFKISVVAVYNGAKPVVVDTGDSEVIRNILTDLPMSFAFKPGQTKLLEGIEEAAKLAKGWKPRSTVLVLMSDGDTVPATGMPKLPPSIMSTLVVGVGDPLSGSFIDGRQSRQDVSTLRQIATRLGGVFHNGNQQHLASATIRQVSEKADRADIEKFTKREYALLCMVLGAAMLAFLPLLLHAFGTSWQPGAKRAVPAAPQRLVDRRGGLPKKAAGTR